MSEGKKLGRPRKYMEARDNLTITLTTSVKEAIRQVAYANGRSMAEEVTLRLTASLDQPRLMDELAGRLAERVMWHIKGEFKTPT